MNYFFSPALQAFFVDTIHLDLPEDARSIPAEAHAALMTAQSQGWAIVANAEGDPVATPPAPPTDEQLQGHFVAAIQQRLDDFARARNYDGILSACTYATSSVPRFLAEGMRAVELRDQTWAAAYAILEEVQAGQRAMPASLADIEADLPQLEWPQ